MKQIPYLRLAMAMTYFFIASKFFPLFQFAPLAPFVFLFAEKKKPFDSLLLGAVVGCIVDSLSYTYPYGFYTIPLMVIGYCASKLKQVVATESMFPRFFFSYLASTVFIALLILSSSFFGRPLQYEMSALGNDLLFMPLLETSIALLVLDTIPFMVKKKFFIANFLRSLQKEKHG